MFLIDLFFYRAHLANDGHRINTNDDNASNIFVTQATKGAQNENLSDTRSNASIPGIPKLPQISSTDTT